MKQPDPSEIAAQTKKFLRSDQNYGIQQYRHTSHLYNDLPDPPVIASQERTNVSVLKGNAIDIALTWSRECFDERIPAVTDANEKRPGGDWETRALGPEEDLARRSSLTLALQHEKNYPLPNSGGIYSLYVCVYRFGHSGQYKKFAQVRTLPIISVAPVSNPKLDEHGMAYKISAEENLMKSKMKTALCIALKQGHNKLVIGAFGLGRRNNPAVKVAKMWRELLFDDEQLKGAFREVVFGIDSCLSSELQIFQAELDVSIIFPTNY